MDIRATCNKTHNTYAGDLKCGDIFVRDGNKHRPLSERETYMVMYSHSRFCNFGNFASTNKGVVVVQMSNARLSSVREDQHVLQLDDSNLRLPLKD